MLDGAFDVEGAICAMDRFDRNDDLRLPLEFLLFLFVSVIVLFHGFQLSANAS
jgi:hypothetical protein